MSPIQTYLAAKLAEDGFSGIAGDFCGCTLDNLFACECPGFDCEPGYLHECAAYCPRMAECNCPVEDGCTGYCVSASKDWPEAEE